MERKIGEIFEYNGEWYQCVTGSYCHDCAFGNDNCEERERITLKETPGLCVSGWRSDCKPVIFKKLEKVGEPYELYGHLVQKYRFFHSPAIQVNGICISKTINTDNIIKIEIKQNKEDMEESVEEKLFCDKVAKANAEYMKVKLNSSLKSFDIKAAKAGKPVCTRDGRKARIICFDRICGDDYYKIVACVTDFDGDFEEVLSYGIDGYIVDSQNPKDEDLMMLPEKKEGWVNVYNSLGVITFSHNPYDTKEEALASEMESPVLDKYYVDTVKVEWEE